MTNITIVSRGSELGASLASNLAESLRATGKFDSVRVVGVPQQAASGYVPASDLIKQEEDRQREEDEQDGVSFIKDGPQRSTVSVKIPSGIYVSGISVGGTSLNHEPHSCDECTCAPPESEDSGDLLETVIIPQVFMSRVKAFVLAYLGVAYPNYDFWTTEVTDDQSTPVREGETGYYAFNINVTDGDIIKTFGVSVPGDLFYGTADKITYGLNSLINQARADIDNQID